MSEERNELSVYELRRFEKALNKLSDTQLKMVEDEIDKIIERPEIGVLKKGDLAYLRVHILKIDNQQALLGYSWIESRLEIYLLQLSSHENFYQKMKGQCKTDLKKMKL